MAIDAEMKTQINDQIAQIDYERQTNLSIHQIMDRFTRMLAQIDIDKEDLIRSKFDWSKQPYFAALSVYLYEVHADRVAAEGKGPGSKLKELMPKFTMNHKVLCLVTKFIIKKTENPNLITAYNKVKEGSGKIDILHDILALSSALRDFLDLTAEYTPRGIHITEVYLDVLTQEVEDLLTINSTTKNSGTERGILVDKQSKLITLCLEAMDYIRQFAEGAYCLDMDYFRKHYTINDFHRRKDSNDEEGITAQADENPQEAETGSSTNTEATE